MQLLSCSGEYLELQLFWKLSSYEGSQKTWLIIFSHSLVTGHSFGHDKQVKLSHSENIRICGPLPVSIRGPITSIPRVWECSCCWSRHPTAACAPMCWFQTLPSWWHHLVSQLRWWHMILAYIWQMKDVLVLSNIICNQTKSLSVLKCPQWCFYFVPWHSIQNFSLSKSKIAVI